MESGKSATSATSARNSLGSLILLKKIPRSKHNTRQYTYTPLHDNCIRIITIRPGWGSQHLKLSLDSVPLGATGKYTALSYAWGNQLPSVLVAINGQHFRISKTVFEALIRLRSMSFNVRVWIDSVCINQGDLAERGSQVQLMKEIYSTCTTVTVWLGEDEEHGNVTSKLLNKLAKLGYHIRHKSNEIRPYNCTPVLSEREVKIMVRFFQKSWFLRVWVVQEYVLGKAACLIFGNFYISSEGMYQVCDWILSARQSCYLGKGFENFVDLVRLRKTYLTGSLEHRTKDLTFTSLFNYTQDRGVTDPKDKVFGILALALYTDGITPDYTKTKEQIYAEVTKLSIRSEGNLRVIENVPREHEHWPSWIPDWSFSHAFPRIKLMYSTFKRPFNASLCSKPRIDLSASSIMELSLRGKSIDTISSIWSYREKAPRDGSRPNLEHTDEELCYFDLESFKAMSSAMNLPNIYHVTGESLEKAYKRSLMADQDIDSDRISEESRPKRFFAGNTWLYFPNQRSPELQRAAQLERARLFWRVGLGRKFFVSSKGYIGILPHHARQGDLMCVLLGGELLYILRKAKVPGEYWLIGECYAHGLMDGEALQGVDLETEVFENFKLV